MQKKTEATTDHAGTRRHVASDLYSLAVMALSMGDHDRGVAIYVGPGEIVAVLDEWRPCGGRETISLDLCKSDLYEWITKYSTGNSADHVYERLQRWRRYIPAADATGREINKMRSAEIIGADTNAGIHRPGDGSQSFTLVSRSARIQTRVLESLSMNVPILDIDDVTTARLEDMCERIDVVLDISLPRSCSSEIRFDLRPVDLQYHLRRRMDRMVPDIEDAIEKVRIGMLEGDQSERWERCSKTPVEIIRGWPIRAWPDKH